jgi:hypothetical protein
MIEASYEAIIPDQIVVVPEKDAAQAWGKRRAHSQQDEGKG